MPLTIAVQWSEAMELAKHQLECWPRDYRMNYKSVFLFRQHIVKFRGFVCLPFSTMHICTFICVKKHVHICTINLLMVLYMFRSSSFFWSLEKKLSKLESIEELRVFVISTDTNVHWKNVKKLKTQLESSCASTVIKIGLLFFLEFWLL